MRQRLIIALVVTVGFVLALPPKHFSLTPSYLAGFILGNAVLFAIVYLITWAVGVGKTKAP